VTYWFLSVMLPGLICYILVAIKFLLALKVCVALIEFFPSLEKREFCRR